MTSTRGKTYAPATTLQQSFPLTSPRLTECFQAALCPRPPTSQYHHVPITWELKNLRKQSRREKRQSFKIIINIPREARHEMYFVSMK